jgi:hypothetical protein
MEGGPGIVAVDTAEEAVAVALEALQSGRAVD